MISRRRCLHDWPGPGSCACMSESKKQVEAMQMDFARTRPGYGCSGFTAISCSHDRMSKYASTRPDPSTQRQHAARR